MKKTIPAIILFLMLVVAVVGLKILTGSNRASNDSVCADYHPDEDTTPNDVVVSENASIYSAKSDNFKFNITLPKNWAAIKLPPKDGTAGIVSFLDSDKAAIITVGPNVYKKECLANELSNWDNNWKNIDENLLKLSKDGAGALEQDGYAVGPTGVATVRGITYHYVDYKLIKPSEDMPGFYRIYATLNKNGVIYSFLVIGIKKSFPEEAVDTVLNNINYLN